MKCSLLRRTARQSVMTTYTTLRTTVKAGRAAKPRWSREKMVSKLLNVARGRHGGVGRIVIQRIAQNMNGWIRQKKLWGNIRKDYDNLFNLLQARAPVPVDWTQADCRNFVGRAIRARVSEQTSARFQKLRCSLKPLPHQLRPYQVLGYGVGFAPDGSREGYNRLRVSGLLSSRSRTCFRALLAARLSAMISSRRLQLLGLLLVCRSSAMLLPS